MIVGLAGAAGSGKDTAGQALIDKLGYSKVFFAQRLKEVLCDLFLWDMSDWEDSAWKERPNPACYGHTPRYMAQTLGTDWGRDLVNDNIWLDLTLQELTPESRSVVSDIRFPNEAAAIRNAGGIILFITCRDRETSTSSNEHASERWLEWLHAYADAEVSADFGHIEELQQATINTVENYLHSNVPRFEPSGDTVAPLNDIHARTLAGLEQERG